MKETQLPGAGRGAAYKTMFGDRRQSDNEYTEGPVRGKCKNCDYIWTISQNADDGWHNECPRCGTEGDYILDPREP